MPNEFGRVRIFSPDGCAHTTTVKVVADDGTETPLTDAVTRVELTCVAEGMWQAVLWIDASAVDVVVDDVHVRDAAERPAESKES